MEVLKIILVTLVFCEGVFGVTLTKPATDPADATNDVAEDAAAAFVTETLTATGTGPGALTFSIVSEDGSTTAADWHFEMSTPDVVLKANAGLNFETKSEYVLVVKVADSGDTTSATATMTVSITDVNEAPAFALALEPACISSSSTTDDMVGTWTATDPDTTTGAANGAVTAYSINSGDGLTQFQISSAGAVTRTAVALDATVQTAYFLVLRASDGALNGDGTVAIYLDSTFCSANGLVAQMISIISVLFFVYQML